MMMDWTGLGYAGVRDRLLMDVWLCASYRIVRYVA
jgi:hypothetical protein